MGSWEIAKADLFKAGLSVGMIFEPCWSESITTSVGKFPVFDRVEPRHESLHEMELETKVNPNPTGLTCASGTRFSTNPFRGWVSGDLLSISPANNFKPPWASGPQAQSLWAKMINSGMARA